VYLRYQFGTELLQPGQFGGGIVGVDVEVHPAGAVAEPLDQQPQVMAGQLGAVVLGVPVEPDQLLTGSPAPEREFAVMIGFGNIDHDLGQPAVVRHHASLGWHRRRTRTGAPARPW